MRSRRRQSAPFANGADKDKPASKEQHRATLAKLLPYLWVRGRAELKFRVIAAMAALVFAQLAAVYAPFFLKGAVDGLLPTGFEAPPLWALVPFGLILAYGITRFLAVGLGEFRDAIFVKVGQHATRQVSLETFRHLHGLSLAYHLERKTGSLSRVIERGVRGIDFLLRFLLFNILPTLLQIGLITGLFWYNFGFLYALIAFSSLAFYIGFTFLMTDWRLQFRRRMNEQDNEANSKAIDSLLNYETVKYFTNEAHEAGRFDKALALYEKAAVKSQLSLTLLNVGQGLIIGLGLTALLYRGGWQVQAGILSLGDFVLLNSLLLQIYQPLGFLGFVYREIKQSLTDMETMFDVLGMNPEIQDMPEARDLDLQPENPEKANSFLKFENVSFGYGPERVIIKGLDIEVKMGEKLAIVGPSGAGKSTLARLLFRFYEPSSGRIVINGQDIRTVTQKSLRAAIGVVPQDTVLFNDTIGYNIRYGRPDASDEQVLDAAKKAQVHDFVMGLPDGYDTRVGERGLKLSGGEKQRVAIARTLLKNPPILLLDEATSALDSETEEEIQGALSLVAEGRTSLVIAHRLSTIVSADQILVLDKGVIVERGNFESLMAAKGQFADMWQRQQKAHQAAETLKALEEV